MSPEWTVTTAHFTQPWARSRIAAEAARLSLLAPLRSHLESAFIVNGCL